MKTLLSTLLLLISCHIYCQQYFPVEHLKTNDGFPFKEVSNITKDSQGFMWICTTNDGLIRYDGIEQVTYKHIEGDSTSINSNFIRSVFETNDDKMIIYHGNSSQKRQDLNPEYLDKKTGTFHPVKFLNFDISYSSHNYIHISYSESGKLTALIWPIRKIPTKQNLTISLLNYIGDGTFELKKTFDNPYKFYGAYPIGTNTKGYWFFSRSKPLFLGEIDNYTLLDPINDTLRSFPFKEFGGYHLPFDKKGNFYYPSFHSNDDNEFESFRLPSQVPLEHWKEFRFDNKKNIWLLTESNRVYKYDVTSKQINPFGEFDLGELSLNIFEDQEGTLWIPHFSGIAKIKKRNRVFENYYHNPKGLTKGDKSGVNVYSMAEATDGSIFFLHLYDQLWKMDRKSEFDSSQPKHQAFEGGFLAPEGIIHSDEEGFIWIGISNGMINRLNPESNEITTFDPPDSLKAYPKTTSIISFYPLKKDTFCYLNIAGFLSFFNKKTKVYAIDTTHIYREGVLGVGDSLIWIGTNSTLTKLNSKGKVLQEYKLPKQLKLNEYGPNFFKLLPYKNKIWIGSKIGLIEFDINTKKFKSYTIADGLSHNVIYTIIPHEDHLWLGTQFGLCRFNIKTHEVKNYYQKDGLTHNEFNRNAAVKTKDGTLFFGGQNGINSFSLEQMDSLDQVQAANLVLTQFSKYDGKMDSSISYQSHQLDLNQPIPIYHGDQSFTFRYALLSYANPSENTYWYYLEGYEKEWNYSSKVPFVNYLSIPPGEYTLRVKAKDSRGNSGINELAIPIIVYGPWWNTWWAYGLYAFLAISSITALRYYELKRLRNKSEAKRLKDLDEVKTKLYNNITHEFRTPLTVIMGMADEIDRKPEEAKKMIKRNSKSLLKLINQMLDLSKLEAGKLPLNMVKGNIIPYLQYLTESFHSYAESKQIQLLFYKEVDILVMDYDEEKFQHIISNLLSNAIKFTPENEKVILHANVRKQGIEEELLLEVKDDGMGIDSAVLPYIFDRFYQVDDSTTRQGEGTGIGLALTKELVELMEGNISVKSELGKGTVFTVIFPIKRIADISEQAYLLKENSLQQEELGNIAALPNKVIVGDQIISNKERPLLLIIEDNPDVATYIQNCLEGQYNIAKAPDGQLGIDIAIELVPDIIISDVMMPKKDGFEVCNTLKNDERTSHIPIILLTARATVEDRISGLQRGADAYLIKPFNKEELFIRLQKLIELRQQLQKRYAGNSFLNITSEDQPLLKVEDAFLIKMRTIIEKRLDDTEYNIPQFCQDAGMSRTQMHRKLKALTGKSATIFIRSIRLQKAKELLEFTHLNISEIAYQVGFRDPSYFSTSFLEEFGISPSESRK